MATQFVDKCYILADIWIRYRNYYEFQKFFDYSDLALPYAYGVTQQHIVVREEAVKFIDEAWAILMANAEIEDTGFESLDEMLEAVPDLDRRVSEGFNDEVFIAFDTPKN